MSTPVRWAIVGVAVLLLVGLLGWARGDDHHHGDDVGATPSVVIR